MAQSGTFSSSVTPPPTASNATMVVSGSDGSVSVTLGGTACAVDQNASNGSSLKFDYPATNPTLTYHGAYGNSKYLGKCKTYSAGARGVLEGDDNWTATSTGPGPKPPKR